jgi:hypothetical protein
VSNNKIGGPVPSLLGSVSSLKCVARGSVSVLFLGVDYFGEVRCLYLRPLRGIAAVVPPAAAVVVAAAALLLPRPTGGVATGS